ncbi:DUF1573 domain-containing protein [Neorhodopirellula lusitana]|uniref:DUF1573 domain-containing protein n=1 Tax=Neorhodopirellula lusitana TaxID=445327 RepID=UPI00384E2421
MQSLGAKLLVGVILFGALAATAAAFTLTIEYKPFGVADSQREKWDQIQQKIELHNQLLQSDEARPRVMVPITHYDFGMIAPESTASHAFEVRNEGSDPLALEVAGTSCKCTVGELGKKLLGPGEKTEVVMEWNTGQKSEKYKQNAIIRTNDPFAKEIELIVEGTIKAELVGSESASFASTDRGVKSTASVEFYSQLWDDFSILEVTCDLPGFSWEANPMQSTDTVMIDRNASTGQRIILSTVPNKFGQYSADVKVVLLPTDSPDPVERVVKVSGRVRRPINFYSNDIHSSEGLSLGTLTAGKRYEFPVTVRVRGDQEREVKVLDVEPEVLQTTLKPMKDPGSYRLVIIVPEDCPTTIFNMNQKQGFVQVGDPSEEEFSHWFPIHGAVVEIN